ncbi:MAG: PadR family transcriptional regulator [Candidatus Bathyarchaeia archaeon]
MAERVIKQTSGVPRGILRFLVLNMLADKPMSGTEIVEIIKKETDGRWIPSSGSIYPLLAWLHEKGFTSEIQSEEQGVKRYTLTAKGKIFFEKQIVLGRKLLRKLEFLIPLFIGKFKLDPNDEKILAKTKEPAQKVVKALLDLREENKYHITEQAAEKIAEILNKCANELEEVVRKTREKKTHENKTQQNSPK